MSDVTTDLSSDAVSATTVVEASPAEVFDYLRQPANHPAITGDGTVKKSLKGPERLSEGDRFGMAMKLGVPYRITSKVVDCEEGGRLRWRHPLGHTWSWDLEPAGEGRTKVTETFDLSTGKAPFLLKAVGYPRRHEGNVRQSVANVAAHFAGTGSPA